MPKIYIRKDTGEAFTIYNPAEKSEKYASDLKYGVDTVRGNELSDTQAAWRSGYLKARKDNAKAYKANQKRKAYSKRKKQLSAAFSKLN